MDIIAPAPQESDVRSIVYMNPAEVNSHLLVPTPESSGRPGELRTTTRSMVMLGRKW